MFLSFTKIGGVTWVLQLIFFSISYLLEYIVSPSPHKTTSHDFGEKDVRYETIVEQI